MSEIERLSLDVKEEAGRRGSKGQVLDGTPENEPAVKALLPEIACMANTPGGGALILGVSNDGTLIGTALDSQWLRRRVYDLTDRRVTIDVTEEDVNGHRVLVLWMTESLEAIKVNGRLSWRVRDSCVEIDLSTWHNRLMRRIGYDWSHQSSGRPMADARPSALQRARDFLRDSGEASALDLSSATDQDLLRRLNAVDADDILTNAGALVFASLDVAPLDYIHRRAAGADSDVRWNEHGQSLIEVLYEVQRLVAATNTSVHHAAGFVSGRLTNLPERGVREAIVNGMAHRDWQSPRATVIEHVGSAIVVSSPGGFVGGVNPANIITHPSSPRYVALTSLLADLRVAEREGIGVDRMVGDMIRLGHRPPEINEVEGPFVRVALIGGRPDERWLGYLGTLTPPEVIDTLDSLMLLDHLRRHRWIDVSSAATLLQRSPGEAEAAIWGLETVRHGRTSVLSTIDSAPEGAPAAWHLDHRSSEALLTAPRSVPARRAVAMSWAQHRGRVSSSELAEIFEVTHVTAGSTLKALASEGRLIPSSDTGGGRGFHYTPAS